MWKLLSIPIILSVGAMNYTKASNTYFAVPKDDPRDRIHLEIGDSKQPDFHPQMKIMRWDNEVNFSMRLVHAEKSPKVSKNGEKIKWVGDKTEAHFYDLPFSEELPEGGHECEIVLTEPVPDNRIDFTINHKGLRFLYQSLEFTPEEIAEGANPGSRPEYIKGSYAVYTADPKTNYDGGKLYRSNKVGHIPRPRMVDAVGNWCWGILKIDESNGILSVTIPQDFAETAVYPIRHAAGATFGYTTTPVGGSSAVTDCRSCIGSAMTHTAGAGETVTKMTMSGYSSGGITGFDVAVYTFSTNPVTQLATPVTLVLPASKAWTDSPAVSWALANGTTYCCCFGNDGTGTEYIYWDSGTGNLRDNDTSTGAMPATWTHSAYSAAEYGLYATYSVGGAVTVALTGISETLTPGTIAKSNDKALTGSSETLTRGTVAPSSSVTLTGIAETLTPGTVAPSNAHALTGTAETIVAGTVVASGGSGQNITRVSGQACGNSSYSYSVSKAYPNDVTAGNLIVICVAEISDIPILSEISKIAGSATLGAWTLDKAYYDATRNQAVGIYSAPVTGTGSCTIQWSQDQSNYNYPSIALQEYSGADVSAGRVQGFNTGTNSTGAPTTGTVDSVAGGVFVGALASNYEGVLTITPGADFTQIYEQEDGNNYTSCAFEDRIVTTGTVDAADWLAPTTNPWVAAVVVYKAAGGGSPDVTVALTGIAETLTAGTVAPSNSKALTGSSETLTPGTIAPNSSAALTGSAETLAAGTVAPSSSKALTGISMTLTSGTVAPSNTAALTGNAETLTAGTVAPSNSKALTGSSETLTPGTIAPNSSAALTGSAEILTAGTVASSSSKTLTGILETLVPGTVAPSSSVVLTGSSETLTAGTVTANIGGDVNVALTGISMTLTPGTVAPSNTAALTGSAETLTSGTVAPSSSKALTGISMTLTPGTVAPSSSAALAGSAETLTAGTVAPSSFKALTGNAETVTAGTVATSNSMALTGSAETLTAGTVAPSNSKALTGISMTLTPGTVAPSNTTALTGSAETFTAGTVTAKKTGEGIGWLQREYWWNYPYN